MPKSLPDIPLSQPVGTSLPDHLSAEVDGLSNPWAIHPDTARYLSRYIIGNRITRIIEFGAGASSVVFSNSMAHVGGGKLTSFEENPVWCHDAWDKVRRVANVDSQLVGVRTRLKLDRRGCYFGYDLPELPEGRLAADLVFIDAPHGSMGRAGGAHAVIDRLPAGAVLFFDDTSRPRDQQTISLLLRRYPHLEVTGHSSSLGRGLTAVTVREKATGRCNADLSATCLEVLSLFRAGKVIRKVRSKSAESIEQAA